MDTYACIRIYHVAASALHAREHRPNVIMKVKVLVSQLGLTLCNPMDCSPEASLFMGFSRQE